MKDVDILTNNGIDVTKALELFGTMDKYDKTLTLFYDSINDKLTQLKSFKETGDMAQYAVLVHGLKSEARYFGMAKFGDLAYDHELGARANNMYYISDNFNELITEISRVVEIVGQYLGREMKLTATEEALPIIKDKAILVVDDSDVIMQFIRQIFDNKYEVLVARDGNEAIDIIKNQPEGKIMGMLLDLHMPKVDGFAVLDYMQQQALFEKLPVCIITGIATKEIDEKAFTYPIIDMIKKPFNERDIKVTVERFIAMQS